MKLMNTKKPRALRKLLVRGESLVASAGLAVAAILLGVMAASAWWAMDLEREGSRRSREEQVRAVATMLARSAEGLLEHDSSLSAVRRLALEASASYGLETCRITLPGAGDLVIADGAPDERIRYSVPPAEWGLAMPAAEAAVTDVEGAWEGETYTARALLRVSGRGQALLEVSAGGRAPAGYGAWGVQTGLGAIGAMGLCALLWTYRAARARLRGLGAIREGLLLAASGEVSEAELRIDEDLGPEAAVWNRLLADRERLREQSRRERAGEQLSSRRGREGEMFNVCDALWQGLLLIDERMSVKYANGAAAVFLGTKREEAVGVAVERLLTEPRVVEAVRGVVSGTARSRSTIEIERGGDKGGTTVLRLTVRPVRREDSASALVVIEDVTQQKVADESRNSFVAQATHELRTPLTNIRLYVEALLDREHTDEKKRMQAVNVISQESRRLERIVGDMLSVSEIEAGSLKLHTGDVRLQTLFEELAADYEAQAKGKDITLRFDLPPKWPVLVGDRDKIALAVHNLIGNAIKYTPAGGEVVVRVTEEKGRLLVDVVDNGIGIKEDECELVFEKFYRAKDKRISSVTGTGLGLAIAREVVRLHGGDITVRSQLDKGSTFTLSLPVAAAA